MIFFIPQQSLDSTLSIDLIFYLVPIVEL